MKGSLKGSCCPPSITAAEPARVTALEGPLEANHRPFRAEPPAGGGAMARCHAADSSQLNKHAKQTKVCCVCLIRTTNFDSGSERVGGLVL